MIHKPFSALSVANLLNGEMGERRFAGAQAGVNVDLGLDYCAGDEDFYREMLQMFCAQGEEKRAEIISLYESAYRDGAA